MFQFSFQAALNDSIEWTHTRTKRMKSVKIWDYYLLWFGQKNEVTCMPLGYAMYQLSSRVTGVRQLQHLHLNPSVARKTVKFVAIDLFLQQHESDEISLLLLTKFDPRCFRPTRSSTKSSCSCLLKGMEIKDFLCFWGKRLPKLLAAPHPKIYRSEIVEILYLASFQ